jgi:diguanylate cyclase (GGDEF)-like protein
MIRHGRWKHSGRGPEPPPGAGTEEQAGNPPQHATAGAESAGAGEGAMTGVAPGGEGGVPPPMAVLPNVDGVQTVLPLAGPPLPRPIDRGTVLVVDDDPAMRQFLETNLRLDGYDVLTAADGPMAVAIVATQLPDLVLLEVGLPGIDGIELTRRWREDSRTATLPVIMVTARSSTADRVLGLQAGADDYVTKPFDVAELLARVRSTMRRNAEARAMSPLTNLPGNLRIEDEIARRVASGRPFAVAYLDLDNFKAFNDAHGFLRGDQVILLLAMALRRAVVGAKPPAFIGHVGGDDFVLICQPHQVEELCRYAVEYFDEHVQALHDPKDVERGYLEVVDRKGVVRRFPLVSVSVGVATSERRTFRDYREVVAVATEMKSVAKAEPGSAIAVDRRGY